MKYLILIYHNQQARETWLAMSETERGRGLQAYSELNRELAGSGEMIAAEALAEPEMGKRVTFREGGALATDGPFAEVKEALAGIYLVDCETEARAVEIAGRIPEARFGLVEVRPVMTYAGLEG